MDMEIESHRRSFNPYGAGEFSTRGRGLPKHSRFYGNWPYPPPDDPTDAAPGSDEKILVLAERYSLGLGLWHPDDRTEHGPGGES